MLLLLKDTKYTVYLGMPHYDIFVLKQNNLLIIKVSFSFITFKAVKETKSATMNIFRNFFFLFLNHL